MTVSVSQGRLFTIDQHVRNALRHAGLVAAGQEATKEELADGRTELQLVINGLEAEGFPARTTGFLFEPMIADQFKYTLPLEIYDVLHPAMYIDETEEDPERASSETLVKVITEQEYTRLSAKSAKGRPYLLYPDRGQDQVIINLWPIPDANGANLRLRVVRKYFDTDDGEATLDLQRFWDVYINKALAARLAFGGSMVKKAATMEASAATLLRRCKGQARERPGTQAFVTHRGGYYNA